MVLLDKDELNPGESGYAQLCLEEKTVFQKGERFVIRFYSPVETIGGGIVLDCAPKKHRRYDERIVKSCRIRRALVRLRRCLRFPFVSTGESFCLFRIFQKEARLTEQK